MAKVYLVIADSGEYEDCNTSVERVFSSEKKAQDYIDAINASNTRLRDAHKAGMDALKVWQGLNPPPETPWLKTSRPKWKAGLRKADITPEMRAVRDEFDRHQVEESKLLSDYHLMGREAGFLKAALSFPGLTEIEKKNMDYFYPSIYDTHYTIQEMEVE